MNQNKIPERKTYLQERFEILIKRQKSGEASFNELTELDEIVNKNTSIREQILQELGGIDNSSDDMISKENNPDTAIEPKRFWLSVKLFFDRLFSSGIVHQNPLLI